MKKKIKLVNRILTIALWLVIWIVSSLVIQWAKEAYYNFANIENFIVFEQLDFQDYKKWADNQLLYSYRNSKQTTVGDFYYKAYCNEIANPEWSYQTPWIILEKTTWFKKIKVKMPVVLDLPVWECRMEAKIIINIKWYNKEVNLTDYFTVLP